MILYLLIANFILALLILNVKNNRSRYFAFIQILSFIFICASFEKNVDRENYELHISTINRLDLFSDSLEKLVLLKMEPTFILITYIVKVFSDSNFYIYLIYSMIALWSKYFSTRLFVKYNYFFIGIYLLFFAPSLEFAAIRIAASLGLIFLGIYYESKEKVLLKMLYLILACLFHYSSILFIIPYLFLKNLKFKFINLILLLVFPFLLSNIFLKTISGIDRLLTYEGLYGTIYSLIYPFVYLIILFFFIYFNFSLIIKSPKFIQNIIKAELFLSGLSIGVCLKFVIFSYRILEIQSFFLLIVLFYFLGNVNRGPRFNLIFTTLIFLLTLTSFRVLSEGLWKNLI